MKIVYIINYYCTEQSESKERDRHRMIELICGILKNIDSKKKEMKEDLSIAGSLLQRAGECNNSR